MGENKTSVLMLVLRKMRLFAYVSFAIVFVLSIFIINPIADSTEGASAATGTATPSTTELTISGLGHTSSINVTPIDNGGAFISGGEINFSLSTNNYTGYVVQLTDIFNNGRLINVEDESLYIEPIDDYYTAETFPTNKWGIKPSKYVDVANSSDSNVVVVDNTGEDAVFIPFYVAPIDAENNIYGYAAVVDYNSIAGSQNYSVSLGAKVDKTIPSGTYESTYSLLAMANPAPYSISFDKNTEDVVFSLPVTRHSESNTATTMNIPNMVPQREHYSFLGWCNVQPTNTNGTDSCTGTNPTTGATATVYNPNGDGTNLTYGLDHTVSNTNVTLYAMWQIDTFTCTKQYRLQNADGTWGNYVADGTETINYGGSCAYAKTVTDYKNATNGTNNAQASTTATNVTDDVTVSLDFYRNTYALTVSKGDNITAVTGAGTYRWGDTATITATKTANVTCISYANPTYTATAGTAPTAGASTTYTMPKSNATVTATSAASNIAQTITFKTSNATNITLDGNTKTNNQTLSINCGTYDITGTIPANYHFVSWGASAGSLGSTSQLSTTYTVSGPATVTLTGAIDTYVQTTRYRYENADGSWGSWTTAETATKDYGSSYSWDTSKISNFDSTTYQAASVASYTVTSAKTNDVSIYRNTFTCTKQYRLETAAGGWGSYTDDTSETVRYGASCSYSKTVTDYRGASNAANGAQGSTSASNITENKTLQLSFYRNTYALTVSAGSNTSTATGAGTYRWGQTVAVGVTKTANVTCTTYAAPTWSQGTASGTIGSTSNSGNVYSMSYTMPKSAATVTATSAASNVAQTVTLSKGTGVTGINIGGTDYAGTSASLNCGTYTVSGIYSNESYVFSSWSRANGVTLASTATDPTTMTVSGAGTLTLNGILYMQNVTEQNCPSARTIAYDNRDGKAYYIQKITYGDVTRCWMTSDLDLTGGVSLYSDDSNVPAGYLKNDNNPYYVLPASNNTFAGSSPTSERAYNTGTECRFGVAASSSGCGSYYSYAATTAGTNPDSGNAEYDICPKNWRLPSSDEYSDLTAVYSTNQALRESQWVPITAGFINVGPIINGSQGYYWASTADGNDNTKAYLMNWGSSTPRTYSDAKGRGRHVRCILHQT